MGGGAKRLGQAGGEADVDARAVRLDVQADANVHHSRISPANAKLLLVRKRAALHDVRLEVEEQQALVKGEALEMAGHEAEPKVAHTFAALLHKFLVPAGPPTTLPQEGRIVRHERIDAGEHDVRVLQRRHHHSVLEHALQLTIPLAAASRQERNESVSTGLDSDCACSFPFITHVLAVAELLGST